jgi:hypothetical protein
MNKQLKIHKDRIVGLIVCGLTFAFITGGYLYALFVRPEKWVFFFMPVLVGLAFGVHWSKRHLPLTEEEREWFVSGG